MPLNLEKQRAGRPISVQRRNIPIEQIVAVRGRNPLGESLPGIGQALIQGLERRKAFQDQVLRTAALERLSGAAPGSFSGLTPEDALETIRLGRREERQETWTPIGIDPRTKKLVERSSAGGIRLSDNPSESQLLPLTRNPQDVQTLDIRAENLETRKSTGVAAVVDRFNRNPVVAKAFQSKTSAGDVSLLAESGNPIAAASIPTYMARMAGEVGALTEADKAPFGGSRSILRKFEASLKQMATGQLSDQNRQFVLGMTTLIQKRADEKILGMAERFSRQHAGLYGATKNDYLTRLTADLADGTPLPEPPQTPQAQRTKIGLQGEKAKRLEFLRAKKARGELR